MLLVILNSKTASFPDMGKKASVQAQLYKYLQINIIVQSSPINRCQKGQLRFNEVFTSKGKRMRRKTRVE